MAASVKWSLSAVSANAGATYIPVKTATWDHGVELALAGAGTSAGYMNAFAAGMRAFPKVSLEFEDIGAAYAALSDYTNINSSPADLTLHFTQLEHGTFRATGATSGKTISINKGMAIARTLRATHNQVATVSYDVFAVLDGSNEGFIIDDSTALPSTTTVAGAVYDCGPLKIQSTFYGLREWTFDWGFQELLQPDSGLTRSEACRILRRDPKATAKLLDLSVLEHDGVITEWGKDPAQTVTLFLRKMDNNATDYRETPTSNDVHLSIEFGSGMFINPTTGNAPWAEVADFSIDLTPVFDGTNAICTIDTTASIQ